MKKICAVRDRAVDAYGQPIFVNALGQAVRSFQDEIRRKDSEMGAHADDYDLYHIGDYDDSTGTVSGVTPVMIAIGKEQVEVKNV